MKQDWNVPTFTNQNQTFSSRFSDLICRMSQGTIWGGKNLHIWWYYNGFLHVFVPSHQPDEQTKRRKYHSSPTSPIPNSPPYFCPCYHIQISPCFNRQTTNIAHMAMILTWSYYDLPAATTARLLQKRQSTPEHQGLLRLLMPSWGYELNYNQLNRLCCCVHQQLWCI